MRKWNDARRSASVLRDEPRRSLLSIGREASPALSNPGYVPGPARFLDGIVVYLRFLWTASRLHHLRGIGVLYSHHRERFHPACARAAGNASLPGFWLSSSSGAVHRNG